MYTTLFLFYLICVTDSIKGFARCRGYWSILLSICCVYIYIHFEEAKHCRHRRRASSQSYLKSSTSSVTDMLGGCSSLLNQWYPELDKWRALVGRMPGHHNTPLCRLFLFVVSAMKNMVYSSLGYSLPPGTTYFEVVHTYVQQVHHTRIYIHWRLAGRGNANNQCVRRSMRPDMGSQTKS